MEKTESLRMNRMFRRVYRKGRHAAGKYIVLYALEKKGKFSQRWRKDAFTTDAIPELVELLEEEGALIYINNMVRKFTQDALQALENTRPQGEAGKALNELVHWLLERQS